MKSVANRGQILYLEKEVCSYGSLWKNGSTVHLICALRKHFSNELKVPVSHFRLHLADYQVFLVAVRVKKEVCLPADKFLTYYTKMPFGISVRSPCLWILVSKAKDGFKTGLLNPLVATSIFYLKSISWTSYYSILQMKVIYLKVKYLYLYRYRKMKKVDREYKKLIWKQK